MSEKGRNGFKLKKHLEKKKEEESASGIAVDDVTELETLTDEIIDREKLAEKNREGKGKDPLTLTNVNK